MTSVVSRQHHMTTVDHNFHDYVLQIWPFTGMPFSGSLTWHQHASTIPRCHTAKRKKEKNKNWWSVVLLVIIPLHWEVNPHHFLVALASAGLFSISSLITIGTTCFVSVAATSVTAPPSPCLVDDAVCLWLWACVPVQQPPSLSPCSLLISLVQIGTN